MSPRSPSTPGLVRRTQEAWRHVPAAQGTLRAAARSRL